MIELKVGDSVWHPCSLDIIEHKVISITQYERFTHCHVRSVKNVGACGRVEVILDVRKDTLLFVELVDEDTLPYARGLQDFVEGKYYTTLNEARIEFYKVQERLALRDVENLEKRLKDAKSIYETVKLLIKTFKEDINATNNTTT